MLAVIALFILGIAAIIVAYLLGQIGGVNLDLNAVLGGPAMIILAFAVGLGALFFNRTAPDE